MPAQTPLTLSQAVQIALEKNPLRKVSLADQQAAAADIRDARAELWPHVSFAESFTRGNDPVYVFGAKLRQRRFTQGDFDLARLNTPTPLNNFATRFEARWNLFDFRESWIAVGRAERLHQAAGRQLERTEQELVFQVIDAYFGLLLAAKQQQVAEEAVRTAEANLERSRTRFEAGLVVESDVLSARVFLASRQQELIRARNAVAVAGAQLNHELGVPAESKFQPVEILAERPLPVAALDELEARALARRPDFLRILLEEEAQKKSVAMAKAAFGPRVNLITAWEADNPAFLGNGGTNWVGSLEVEFDLFQGGAKQARLARERAVQDRFAALRARAESALRLEVRRAYFDQEAARQQVEVARASVAQAQESLRIIQNRYEAGLTTVTDLLRAEEDATRSQTQYWEAVYRWLTSYANLELARGTLSPQSPVVVAP
ncbi:MAG TPA: TolC family protein [Candidatus Xenobia bacterium]|nr:TolC family protein [Candidatus Xenobia bacterium]